VYVGTETSVVRYGQGFPFRSISRASRSPTGGPARSVAELSGFVGA